MGSFKVLNLERGCIEVQEELEGGSWDRYDQDIVHTCMKLKKECQKIKDSKGNPELRAHYMRFVIPDFKLSTEPQ